jgi:hypothetical protein
MLRRAPNLTIRIRPSDSEKAFLFEDDQGRGVAVGSKSAFERAVFEQSNLRIKLEELKTIGGGRLELTPQEADQALRKLYEAGKLVMFNLFDGMKDLDFAADLSDLIRTTIGAARLRGETPRVQVSSVDNDPISYAVPFELVPFQMTDRPRSITTDSVALGEALDGFLGFSAVVSRNDGNLFTGRMISKDDDRLPIKLFQNVSLPHVSEEIDYFRRQPSFDVEGPWPLDTVSDDQFPDILLRQIFDPTRRIDGSPRPLPDQIQHFACHCDTFGASNEHRFILAGDPARQLPMSLSDLRIRMLELSQKGERCKSDMPLIFLNACGAAAVDPRQVGSFVEFFLGNRNRGFIGAQTMIPDAFAHAYAEMFYGSLMTQSMCVGEAVLNARRKLAERKLNILGSLYMHYGPAELCLIS